MLSRARRIETYQSQDCSRRRHRQQCRTLEIKLAHRIKDASPRALQPDIIWDHDRRHGHAQEQRRDLDAKLPSPAERLGHGAAEGSSEGRAGAEIDGDIGLVGASASDGESAFTDFLQVSQHQQKRKYKRKRDILYRHQVARNDTPQRGHPSSAKSAKRSRCYETLDTSRQGAPNRRNSKDAQAGYE